MDLDQRLGPGAQPQRCRRIRYPGVFFESRSAASSSGRQMAASLLIVTPPRPRAAAGGASPSVTAPPAYTRSESSRPVPSRSAGRTGARHAARRRPGTTPPARLVPCPSRAARVNPPEVRPAHTSACLVVRRGTRSSLTIASRADTSGESGRAALPGGANPREDSRQAALFERAPCGVPGSPEGRMIWSAPIRTTVSMRRVLDELVGPLEGQPPCQSSMMQA